jgi:hypothetical protein
VRAAAFLVSISLSIELASRGLSFMTMAAAMPGLTISSCAAAESGAHVLVDLDQLGVGDLHEVFALL